MDSNGANSNDPGGWESNNIVDDKTPKQWEEALFPELLKTYQDRIGSRVRTLEQLGFKRFHDATERGFVQIRQHRGRSRPALWIHQDDLPIVNDIAVEIAEKRSTKEDKARERVLKRRERARALLEAYPWVSQPEQDAIVERSESWSIENITDESLRTVLYSRRLAHAISGLSGVRMHGDKLLVTGTLTFEAFGESFERVLPKVGTITLSAEQIDELFSSDFGDFRSALTENVARIRAEGLARARELVAEQIREANRIIDETASVLELDADADASVREALAADARARLSRSTTTSEFTRGLEETAREAIWSHRKELLRVTRSEREGRWHVTRDHKSVYIAYALTVRLSALDQEYSTLLHRKVAMPRDLREAFFSQPFDVFTGIGGAFVAEALGNEESLIERSFSKLVHRINRALAIPGIDVAALRASLKSEFSNQKFDAETVTARMSALVERLTKKAHEAQAVHDLLTRASFSQYGDFFTTARKIRRRLTLYVGPTNSGKTYHALNTLAEGETGVYLAPLRLLALEGQEEIEKRGKPTSFLTGEERDLRPGARFFSSTIEMLNFDRMVDTAVIDEVQLLSDSDRGWAWSAAIIGAPAEHIVMTGSPDCIPLVEAIARYLGEPLEIHRLERFTPLDVHSEATDLDSVTPGTAIICFSRRDVLGLKQYLEHHGSVSVIYGNLSPQVRREEARRFRSGETRILVATDAIALGLNLPIRTVVFYSTWKWNGREDIRLTPSEVRQIGGRAGRYGKHDAGFVGALSHADLEYIRLAFSADFDPIDQRAQVRPSLHHVQTMADVIGSKSLARVLDLFRRRISFDDPLLYASVPDDMIELASLADSVGMPLEDKFVFACAPVDTRNAYMMRMYQLWMQSFAAGRVSRPEKLISVYTRPIGEIDPEAFYQAEVQVKLLTVYAWLAYRYPSTFPDLEECDRQRRILNTYIERTLRKKGRMRRCSSCGSPLPPLTQFTICDACYRRRRKW